MANRTLGKTRRNARPSAWIRRRNHRAAFESIGLYWKPDEGGSPDNVCRVSYRSAATGSWRGGHPLWFDPSHHEGLPQNSREYRGSLVHLQPGTDYEIRLLLEKTKTEQTLGVRTWDNTPTVKKTLPPGP